MRRKRMIKINLIKERVVIPSEKRESLFFLFAIFFSVLFFSLLVLSFIYSTNKRIIYNYSSRLEKQKKEEGKKMFSLTKEEEVLLKELKEISIIKERCLLYSPKLTALANLIPSDLYLTQILMEGNDLILGGKGAPGNGAIASIGIFINKLNEDRGFMKGLSKVKLEEVNKEDGGFTFRIRASKI